MSSVKELYIHIKKKPKHLLTSFTTTTVPIADVDLSVFSPTSRKESGTDVAIEVKNSFLKKQLHAFINCK